MKTLACTALAVILTGCVSNPPQQGSPQSAPPEPVQLLPDVKPDSAAGYRKYIDLQNQKFSTSIYPGYFLMVSLKGDHWMPDVISTEMPQSYNAGQQEIFYVSMDKTRWVLAISDTHKICDYKSKDTSYSVCTSRFGSLSTAGLVASALVTLGTSMLSSKPMVIDTEAAQKAVRSIPEDALNAAYDTIKARQQAAQEKQAAIAEQQRQAAIAGRQAEAQAEATRHTAAVVALKKSPVGTEDFCTGFDGPDEHFYGAASPSAPSRRYKCQNLELGYVTYVDLQAAGWILTNSIPHASAWLNSTTVFDITVKRVH